MSAAAYQRCPACGVGMGPNRHFFCESCWQKLPEEHRRRLIFVEPLSLKDDTWDAVEAAMDWFRAAKAGVARED